MARDLDFVFVGKRRRPGSSGLRQSVSLNRTVWTILSRSPYCTYIIMSFAEFEISLMTSKASGSPKPKPEGVTNMLVAGRRSGYSAWYKALIVYLKRRRLSVRELSPSSNAKGAIYAKGRRLHEHRGLHDQAGRQFQNMQIKCILDREFLYPGQYQYAGVKSQGRTSPYYDENGYYVIEVEPTAKARRD